MNNLLMYILFTFYLLFVNDSFSKGDFTRQKPVEMQVFLKGKTGQNHFFDPNILRFETGKLYKLILTNKSDSKHYFKSFNFSNSIFTRKVQVLNNNDKIVEIKGNINEIEVFPNNSIEWWFVPVRTGEFDDLFCDVEDKKLEKTHSEMGMIGKIIIE